jgi:hypothetical protein
MHETHLVQLLLRALNLQLRLRDQRENTSAVYVLSLLSEPLIT